MRKLIKILLWIIAIPIVLILIIAAAGYSALRWNFWPPNCSMLPPIPQAVRSCQFSKLDQAKIGTPAKLSFWVSVPAEPKIDQLNLVISGQEPVAMKKINETSFSTEVSGLVGQTYTYQYQSNNLKSVDYSFKLKAIEKNVFDGVSTWTGTQSNVKLPTRKIVFMMDTWTINYNFNFFENTRWNIDSSFKRLQDLGADEVDVFSFIEATGDKNSFTLQPVKSPYKYMRDAAITAGDMKKLAAAGKKYGLDVVIHYNVEADYTQGFNVKDINMIGKGVGGDSAHKQIATGLGAYDDQKSKEWTAKWLDGLEVSILKWGKDAEAAGIYGLDITPLYLVPKFAPNDQYANERYQQIITKLRQVYHGKIFGSTSGNFGGFTDRPTYIDDLDGLYVYGPHIKDLPANPSLAQITTKNQEQISSITKSLAGYAKPMYLIESQASFKDAMSGVADFEFNDYAEALAKGRQADWQLQADAYEGFFRALNNDTLFAGVALSNYWWDDVMNPKYADPLINMNYSFRNKAAEGVVKKWWK